MKVTVLPLFIIIILTACKESVVKQSFSSADSLVVYFKNETAGIVTKTVQTTEKNAIKKMIDLIDSKPAGELQCGYDGKMFFYKDNEKIQEVDFKFLSDTCNHFALLLNGDIMYTSMSGEAIDFIKAIESGMPYY